MTIFTAFCDITTRYYVYIISKWEGGNLIPIYVGRGQKRRAKTYYSFGRKKDKYFEPKTHNEGLNEEMAAIRSHGRDVPTQFVECSTKRKSQLIEQRFIRKYGRLDERTGTLHNRNAGG